MLFTGKKGFGANVKFTFASFFFQVSRGRFPLDNGKDKTRKKNKQTRERGEGAMKVMKINGVRPKMG